MTISRNLQFLDYTCLFCIELHAPRQFSLIVRAVCNTATDVPPPAFLYMNGRILDVLESPLYPEHAPVSLDVEGGFALLLSLFLCLAFEELGVNALTSATRSRSL